MFDTLWTEIMTAVGPSIPRIIAAVAVLFVGWMLAAVVASLARRALLRTELDNRLVSWFASEREAGEIEVEAIAGRGVFWLAMTFVLIAVFQVLGLTLVSEPLTVLLNRIFDFLPRFASAGILGGVAWVLATGVRAAATRLVAVSAIEKRLRRESDDRPGIALSDTLGEVLYWFIFLLFLPGILDALALDGMLGPVEDMLSSVIGFLPNLFTAGLTLLVGWLVARMIQRVASGFVAAAGIDAFSERVGPRNAFGGQTVSRIVGSVVHLLVFIPILIGSLSALGLDAITAPLSAMLETILSSIPRVFTAVLVLAVSYAVGTVVGELVTNVLSGIGFDGVLQKVGLGRRPPEGAANMTPSSIVGSLVLTIILLLAAMEAAGVLGFAALSNMISEFLTIGGHVVFGIVLFGVGLFAANFAADTIAASGAPHPKLLGSLARLSIIVLAGGIALRQMGLANEIVTLAFGAVVGAIAVAIAIAFGVGGRDLAAQQLDAWARKLQE